MCVLGVAVMVGLVESGAAGVAVRCALAVGRIANSDASEVIGWLGAVAMAVAVAVMVGAADPGGLGAAPSCSG